MFKSLHSWFFRGEKFTPYDIEGAVKTGVFTP